MQFNLYGEWHSLCSRLDVQANVEQFYAEIMARYAESHRRCYTHAHLRYCLVEFNSVRRFAVNANAVELALWLHRAVHVPGALDNEACSADYARGFARRMGLRESFVRRVERLISVAARCEASDTDGELMSDVVLSVYGSDTFEVARDYEAALWSECAQLPSGAHARFVRARQEFLKGLLNRRSVYYARYGLMEYEEQAKRNLRAIIAHLVD
jgi:predicted metal-dependent HD superfamily phosphohydrolase